MYKSWNIIVNNIVFSALFTLAYFGLFRVSELVVGRKNQTTGPLKRSDVSIIDNKYAVVVLHCYKTKQRGNPITLKIPSERGTLCPVRSLSEYLKLRPPIDGLLFCHIDGSPVTRSQFVSVLGKGIRACSLGGVFKSHSFRIGRATDLALHGQPSQAIMRLGRWNSDCYRLYIRI